MNNTVKVSPVVPIQERIAQCLVKELQRNNTLTSSFRFTPIATDATLLANDYALLKQELEGRIDDLLANQKKPHYKFDQIDVMSIENTIGLTPAVKTRLEIILTVTRR